MTARPGVSLVEVLVASVLLAIGIAGTLQALATSARLRGDADRREAAVGLLLDRLTWFERLGCAVADTQGVTRLAGGPSLTWRFTVDGGQRRLALDAVRDDRPAPPRTRLLVSRSCDG